MNPVVSMRSQPIPVRAELRDELRLGSNDRRGASQAAAVHHTALQRRDMATKPVQLESAAYIASHRPEPPAPPPLKARHYHLAYTYTGDLGKCITQARWAAPEDASMWAAAFRAPPEGDEVAIDGNHYLTRFGVDPGTGQAQRCNGKGRCAARNPAAGTWLPLIGRIVAA